MSRISARSRIVFGLVALLVSVMMLAIALGLVPSEREAIMKGRARLCESIAVASSVFAARNDQAGLEAMLRGIVWRDGDILSAAVRSEDGSFAAVVEKDAQLKIASSSGDSHVLVPIFSNEKRWGTVEVRFRPLARAGVIGWLARPAVKLVAFVAAASFLVYLFYLRKVLQHLDPSKVVPARVRSALDTLAEGLLVLDSAERIVLANQSFADIAGRAADDLLGISVAKLPWVRDETGADAEQPWTRTMRLGEPQRNLTLRLRDHQGMVRSFVVNCSPVLGQEGKYRGVLASFEDITLLEKQKVELSKSKEAAESANRAKTEFLARMSHEIRTPMNAILGFADVLRRGFADSEQERREYLETIHSSGQHLLELINDVLDLSKIESGRIQLERTRCSPHQIISEAVAVLRARAKQKGIALDYEWDGAVPDTIETDPTRLRQVLVNLIGNAIKFTETGGVRVVARTLQHPSHPKLAVDIIDTGIGIRADALPHLFQPFMQADTSITRRFGGTGLGLSISRQLAQAMGGEVTVQSEYGKGSTFTCTVATGPLAGVEMLDAPPVAAYCDDSTASALRLPPLRVLTVEDGESNQKLIALVLRRAGAAVIDTARNGRDGVEMALRGRYDVVLMDMQMPVMDGYSAAATLRRKGVTIPIIALTAHAMKEEESKCLAAGCSGFLPKPINVDALISTVAAACGQNVPSSVAASPQSQSTPRAGIESTLPTDDPEFCAIVEEFVVRLHEQLGAMESAWREREVERVAELAHWLKGSGGTAGFHDFTAPARRLESLAKEHCLEDIEAAINELQELASQVVTPSKAKTNREGVHS